ncbi:hypothetical protein CC86DRAFT_377933 [Ophiobolus disseminans]|uniref:protein-ribulosamine 3-kinase n=1 Tax=Ophiobolus disseminans TaxID=1469910 RepID=A0A6A7ACM3_9PLEO|nr:hypothetical protein CC86DRAFT_377933 [Ophiobolus disseminans]
MSDLTSMPPPKKQDMLEVVVIDESVALSIGDVGKGMSHGEFEGIKALHQVVPKGVPRPVAWGTYKSNPNIHFYLCDFVDMIEDLPDVPKFCALLAKLHMNSIPLSPNGKFGFHTMTYEGTMWQDTAWLLRPLESHGRKVTPVLVNGDIWYGNIAVKAETGEPIMFDPSVYWGHNEYDLDNMKVPRYRMGRPWMREYHKHMPISAPEEDYEDRINLYEIRGHLCASTLYPDTTVYRKLVISEIRKLVEKFLDGYQGQ